jgi:hypothetical protein
MKYYLYVNHAVARARIHKEGCSHIKQHGGEHAYDQGYWKDFESREAAFAALEQTGKINRRGCSFCAP